MDEHIQWSEKVRSHHLCPHMLDKNRNYEWIKLKKSRSLSPWGLQTFILLAVLIKCRRKGLSTSLFLTERRCTANLSDRRRPLYLQHLQYFINMAPMFTTFTERNSVNDVGGGGACRIVPNETLSTPQTTFISPLRPYA